MTFEPTSIINCTSWSVGWQKTCCRPKAAVTTVSLLFASSFYSTFRCLVKTFTFRCCSCSVFCCSVKTCSFCNLHRVISIHPFWLLKLKGPTKLYSKHYLCVVIILFNTGLEKSAFSIDSFGKLVFCLSKVFWGFSEKNLVFHM